MNDSIQVPFLTDLFRSSPFVVGGLLIVLLFIWLIKSFRYICGPNEVLIFSGRRHRLSDGTVRGFRVVRGGGWRYPFIEKVDRMGLGLMEVPIGIRGAFSRGGIALNVDAIANVKISGDNLVIYNAIERFLGQDQNAIRRVAKETLEGHLRGVLARLTPEEVNEDRLKFAEELTIESENDLRKLGIHLDTLKILHVSDDRHYLDSIGREAIATVVKLAEIAESDAQREAELAEASNQARGSVALSNAEANIARMKNELRKLQAELEAQVKAEEERTEAAAREARARAEQELQQVRTELEKIRLQADQILPAEADQRAQEYKAKGDAAFLRERGLAVSHALETMSTAWADAGDSALAIFLIEDLEKILATAAKGVKKVRIEGLNMIDGGDGAVLASYVSAYPAMLMQVLEGVAKATGIDIPAAIATAGKPMHALNGSAKEVPAVATDTKGGVN